MSVQKVFDRRLNKTITTYYFTGGKRVVCPKNIGVALFLMQNQFCGRHRNSSVSVRVLHFPQFILLIVRRTH